MREKLADGLPPGAHASTFGGNALACAAGLAVLSIIDDEGLLENTRAMGERLGAGLEAIVGAASCAVEARGLGLLRGVRLEGVDVREVYGRLRDEKKMLASIAGGVVIRLAPPLNVSADEIDEALALLGALLGEVSA